MWLTLLGHDVRSARSGPEALNIIKNWEPDVAILDIKMQPMSGHALAQQLCSRLKRRPLLIAVTGLGHRTDLERSHVAGFDYHLVKPFDGEQLSAILKAHAQKVH